MDGIKLNECELYKVMEDNYSILYIKCIEGNKVKVVKIYDNEEVTYGYENIGSIKGKKLELYSNDTLRKSIETYIESMETYEIVSRDIGVNQTALDSAILDVQYSINNIIVGI